MLAAAIDWTPIGVALAAGIPSTVAAVLSFLNRRQLKTPSGDSLGAVAERTHALVAVGVATGSVIAKEQARARAKDEAAPDAE
jgi:cobalamin synthase